jgi:hypothetical protein
VSGSFISGTAQLGARITCPHLPPRAAASPSPAARRNHTCRQGSSGCRRRVHARRGDAYVPGWVRARDINGARDVPVPVEIYNASRAGPSARARYKWKRLARTGTQDGIRQPSVREGTQGMAQRRMRQGWATHARARLEQAVPCATRGRVRGPFSLERTKAGGGGRALRRDNVCRGAL